jgi:hypothetical protein
MTLLNIPGTRRLIPDVMAKNDDTTMKAEIFQWWRQHRLRYNLGLIISGLTAFCIYATMIFIYGQRLGDTDITLFTTLFQAVAYLIAMGVANLCYYLGPVSEMIIRPKNPASYRRVTYGIGSWLSWALPFVIPLLVAVQVHQAKGP